SDIASSTLFTVLDTGLSGANTTTPWGLLSVEATSAAGSSTPLFIIADQSSSTPALLADRYGFFGVATRTPTSVLTAGGDALISGLIRVTGSVGTSTIGGGLRVENEGLQLLKVTGCNGTKLLATDANGNVICDADDTSGGGTINSGTTNRLSYYSGATTLDSANFLALDTSQNFVGIGTSSPYARLTVWGRSATSSRAFEISDMSSTTLFAVLDEGRIGAGSSTPWGQYGFEIDPTLVSSSTPIFTIANQGSSTAALLLDRAGNLGIATSSPGARLAVQGDILGTGALQITTTASSSFSGPIAATVLNITSTTATSTFANGIVLASGCFRLPSGVCAGTGGGGGGSGTVNSGTANRLAYYASAGTAVDSANFLALDTTQNFMGIGTSSPYARLTVWGRGSTSSAAFLVSDIASSTLFSVWDTGSVGIGTTTPYQKLSVAGNAYFDSNIISFSSSSATNLLFNYLSPATTSITNNALYAWTIATSTSASTTPILRINTTANERATTSIIGGFNIDGGAFEYNSSSGITSLDALEIGSLSFDTDAGIISWVDLPVATSSGGILQSYSAQIDSNPLLTLFSKTAGSSGGIEAVGVGIGTTTPDTLLTLTASSTARSASTTVLALDNYLGVNSGPAAANIGVSMLFRAMNSASSTAQAASIVGLLSNVTSGSEAGQLAFYTRTNGASLQERMRIDNTGGVGVGTSTPSQEFAVQGDIMTQFNVTATTNGVCHSGDNLDAASGQGRVLVVCSAAPADIAEWYETESDVEEGDIVMTGKNIRAYRAQKTDARAGTLDGREERDIAILAKAAEGTHSIIGIVSSDPYQTYGRDIIASSTNPQPIALAGRVPVKVNMEAGLIEPGDSITPSTIPGAGRKAKEGELSVAIALQSYDGSGDTDKILVFMQMGYARLDKTLARLSEAEPGIQESGEDSISNISGGWSGGEITQVSRILSANGTWSISEEGHLVVESLVTKKLQVQENAAFGNFANRIGVTLYDEDTGEPYCIKIKAGQMITQSGACSIQSNSSDAPIVPLPPSTEDNGGTPVEEPSSDEPESPLPTSTDSGITPAETPTLLPVPESEPSHTDSESTNPAPSPSEQTVPESVPDQNVALEGNIDKN
ncbi:MAG: cell wall surface anchor family protein, partial [Parcubacteria group bacterium Gr01-1014_66]